MRYVQVKDMFGQISEGMIKRIDDDGTEWFIPLVEGNSDYAKYLEWLAQGNTPESAEE